MKIIRILAVAWLSICSNGYCGAPGPRVDLDTLVMENPCFKQGLSAVTAVGNSMNLAENRITHMVPGVPCWIGMIRGLEAVCGGATAVILNQSIFDSEHSAQYGYAILAIRIFNAVLHGIDYVVDKQVTGKMMNWLAACSVEDVAITLPNLEPGSELMGRFLEITLSAIKDVDRNNLSKYYQNIYDSILILKRNMFDEGLWKKVAKGIGSVSSFLVGGAAGIFIAITGQSAAPTRFLTLISSGMDSFSEALSTAMSRRNAVVDYLNMCQLIFLLRLFTARGVEAYTHPI
ncbi:MAG: hypothetical protein LBF65_01495 [Holosporales bacterium]|jgi:hypothetical protein|nr:hypothetical protein [Holosporales bacterium]